MLVDESVERPFRTAAPYASDLPQRIAARWGPEVHVVRCLGSWENYVYEIAIGGDAAILRVTDGCRKASEQVRAELAFVEFLHDRGLPVVRSIRSARGRLVETIESGADRFSASVFEKRDGLQPSPAQCRALGRDFFRDLGAVIGRLHVASSIYCGDQRQPVDRPALTGGDLVADGKRLAPRCARAASRELASVVEWLAAQRRDADYALIHADLHGRNLLLGESSMTVIDFDDCCYGWFAYDVAVALNWAFHPDHPERERALDWLIDGYAAARHPRDAFRDQVRWFVRVRLVQDYLQALDRLTSAQYPGDWLSRRIDGLESRMRALARRDAGGSDDRLAD